jgi:hypothetical protein
MGDTRYQVDPLITIPLGVRREQAAAVQPLCGKGGMDIMHLLLSEDPEPTIMWGRLYVGDRIVGGILYKDNGPDIGRTFVCVEQGKGYLSVINKGFEDHILGSREYRPIRAVLTANVRVDTDPDRKVPLAHMLQGYRIINRDAKNTLIREQLGILMERNIGSPLPTEEEKKEIIKFHQEAKIERDELAAARGRRLERQETAKRQKSGGRRRKRFSTRRNKKYNVRPVRRCSRRR